MKEIRLWINDDRIYQEPHYVQPRNVDKNIKEWKESIVQLAKEKDADHFIYATKTYNGNEIVEVNLYAVPLNDSEFNKRTDAVYLDEKRKGNTVWFGALHKGTNY